MVPFLLIIMVATSTGVSTTSVEFNNKKACLEAKKEVKGFLIYGRIEASCVQKTVL